jgi:hypothetical protein
MSIGQFITGKNEKESLVLSYEGQFQLEFAGAFDFGFLGFSLIDKKVLLAPNCCHNKD